MFGDGRCVSIRAHDDKVNPVARTHDRISAHRGRKRNDPRDAARVQFEQRARILEAVAHQVAAEGYAGMGIDPVVHIAGLSRRTVYDLFPNGTAELVVAAHQAAIDYGLARVLAAFDAQGDWASGFCAGIGAYARLLRSSDAWARLWVTESLGAPPEARALCQKGCELLVERLEPAVESRAAAHAMLDVVDGATRRALRDGEQIAVDQLAGIALRPVASVTEIRTAIAAATRARHPGRIRPAELEYEAGRLPDPAARERLERIVEEAGAARDGLTLWRVFMALAPSHVDRTARDEVRDLIVADLPQALHFGVPLSDAMRLA
jgi:AcrR family transcriptional regulator